MSPYLLPILLVLLIAFISAEVASADVTTAPASSPAVTLTDPIEQLLVRLANTDGPDRKAVIEQLAKTGDQRMEKIFADFSEGSLYLYNGKVYTCAKLESRADGKFAPLVDPLSRQPVMQSGQQLAASEKDAKLIDITRRDRMALKDALILLRLYNTNPVERLAAITRAGENAAVNTLPALHDIFATTKDASLRNAAKESIALIEISDVGNDPAVRKIRLDAVATLGEMRSGRALSQLQSLLKSETDPSAKTILGNAIERIQNWQSVVQVAGNTFSGLSLSSILILMALGLAITFGLMGVINMAHGELMMIGAYATFLTQQFFEAHISQAYFNYFFVVSIPLSFLAAALVGMLIEATVIRFLYGRPLETLLATWGVSLVLIQAIRYKFGNNIHVNSPTWLQGSFEIVQDVRLPYNRLFIIAFCVACIALMYFIVEKTKLGLLIRATTQNRTMAASLGVSTRRVDMLTFGLGAGLAGLAGCALTQIGGVTPDMGQNYIIDTFLVVVTGGVGKLAGAIWAGLGLGMINKYLEPFFGTVWAKVLILAIVVVFIQRRPSGLFPAKGRLADV